MDEKELGATPEQPEDPFGGDPAVASEQPVQAEEPVQPEESVRTEGEPSEPVTESAQPEEAAKSQPKWIKTVEFVSLICIVAAGLLSALFMCLMSVQLMNVDLMLKDVAENINEAADVLVKLDGNFTGAGAYVSSMFYYIYVMFGMLTGIVAGIVCAVLLIIKIVRQFAMKKPTSLEKTAITSCLFFFAVSAIVLSLAMRYSKSLGVEMTTEYGGATLAGLIICGIMFAAYFICKVGVNYKSYLSDKTKILNGCFNLAWAIIAVIVLCVLTCAPVYLTASVPTVIGSVKVNVGMGFNNVFSDAIGEIVNYGKASDIPDDVALTLTTLFAWGAVGMLIQIWFIFQTGKSLHGAMRGTVEGDKAVKLGSQIWRVVFAVLYLIVTIIVAKEYAKVAGDSFAQGSGGLEAAFKPVYTAPIVILVFSVIGLVIAIVNKFIVKEKAENSVSGI